ncbi:zeta toxin family protein [Nocardia jiangxiensis]|uniref:UDP-N-acetylglucosamine kinase n=1 Tax=Nocardia jiangxiensis TaxID=282685 RepID=A0ABW6RYE2_9NOCA|nr:zeta toxin family protein [Nocardia jiangxiensis]
MRESDGTPDEPRDQTGERDSPVAAVEPEELDRIFHEEIIPGLLSDAASVPSSEKPELVVVGGQMGAGKSTMIAEIKDSFADRGSVLHLSGDDFFRFHPRYEELMAQRDPDAIRHLVRDSGRWFRMAREHAIANRQHVILELAMGDPAKEAGIMREFADNGYTARAEVMAVAEPQSRLSTIGRYLDERIDHGVHRYTPPRLHEASFTGSQEMVGHLESADPPVRIEALTVRSRSGVLFENRRGPDGQWAHVPRAAEEMAHERDRPWTADEKRRYQEQLADVRRRIAQLAELRPEESATLTMLGQELRETEAREAGRLAAMTGTSPVVHQMIPGIEFFDQVRPPADRQTKRMLVFGRADDPVKGAMQAAEMVKKLNEQGIDVDLIVRGVPVDQMRAQLRSLREAAGRDVDVRPYTLERDEILADMRDANVVLMPSRAEGFGLVATEAAGAGVPIVVPSTSGAGRFFGDPDLFPSNLTAGMLVEQGYEDPVPVDRWVDALAHQLSDQDAAWDRALDLQQTLRDRQYTWESAGAALVDATGMVPPREHPEAGIPSDHREPST